MKADCAAGLFFKDMKDIKGWETLGAAALAEKVQRSASPGAYDKFAAQGLQLCKDGGI